MEVFQELFDKIVDLTPTAVTVLLVTLTILAVRMVLYRRMSKESGGRFRVQLVVLLLSFIGLLVVVMSLPVSESTTGQLLSLIGILFSAAIALSATTFVGNIMAGLMLRAVRNFRLGDYVRIGEHFGRVSDRGLFHVEVQTEDRDLTTLPNMYLVTNPVKVVRSSGTLITADVSLGYDVAHDRARTALMAAAEATGLEEPFVHIITLGDFSVTYRIAGLLTDVKSLLSTRSKLHTMMLDHLHAAEIEIVSPTFMNQRGLDPDRRFIAQAERQAASTETSKELPESIVFDKADEAESLEKLRDRRNDLERRIELFKQAVSEAADKDARARADQRLADVEDRVKQLDELIGRREERDR